MNSWDLFDTLVARWDRNPRRIFTDVEKQSGLQGFAEIRHICELSAEEKTLDCIYKTIQIRMELSDKMISKLKNLELKLELEHSFPIVKNVSRVKPSDIVISETYLPEDFLKKLLEKNGITVKKIYASYSLKHDESIWNELTTKPQKHTGDNPRADVAIPEKYGVPAELYKDCPSLSEEILTKAKFTDLAKLVRVLRLSNPGGKYADLWHEQATINIPLLVIGCYYLFKMYGNRRYLFSTREAMGFKKIFNAMYPKIDTGIFYSSRKTLMSLGQSYMQYVRTALASNPVIVDLHGSGFSSNYFYNNLGKTPDYFFLVGYHDSSKYKNYRSLVKRKTGNWSEIEDLNQDIVGSLLDVQENLPIFDKVKYDIGIVEQQQKCISSCVELINKGFPFSIGNDNRIETCARDLLLQLRHHRCALHHHGVVHINDWPRQKTLDEAKTLDKEKDNASQSITI